MRCLRRIWRWLTVRPRAGYKTADEWMEARRRHVNRDDDSNPEGEP